MVRYIVKKFKKAYSLTKKMFRISPLLALRATNIHTANNTVFPSRIVTITQLANAKKPYGGFKSKETGCHTR